MHEKHIRPKKKLKRKLTLGIFISNNLYNSINNIKLTKIIAAKKI